MTRWIDSHGWQIVLALVFVDVITLIIALLIGIHQRAQQDETDATALAAKHAAHQAQHATNQVKVRVCRNSIALIQTDKRQIEGYNRQLAQLSGDYITTLFPNFTDAQVQTLIEQTRAQYNQSKASAYRAIRDLSQNCSADQLAQAR